MTRKRETKTYDNDQPDCMLWLNAVAVPETLFGEVRGEYGDAQTPIVFVAIRERVDDGATDPSFGVGCSDANLGNKELVVGFGFVLEDHRETIGIGVLLEVRLRTMFKQYMGVR